MAETVNNYISQKIRDSEKQMGKELLQMWGEEVRDRVSKEGTYELGQKRMRRM